MGWRRGVLASRRRGIASTATVAASALAVVAALVTADGFPAAQVSLDDAGVWVTRLDELEIGRFNRQLDEFDGSLGTPSDGGVDVLQSGADILIVDRSAQTLSAVDPYDVATAGESALPAAMAVGLNRGVGALLDTSIGDLWVAPGVAVVGVIESKARPELRVGRKAALAVGTDGTVLAASAQARRLVLVPPGGEPADGEYPQGLAADATLQATLVGNRPVLLDTTGAVLAIPGRGPVSLDEFGPGAVLQQPGPAADAVLVATDRALLEVPLDDGPPRRLAAGTGDPGAPVRLGDCVHAAWSADPTYARRCGSAAATTEPVVGATARDPLVLRQNRGRIVLNAIGAGGVWLIEEATPEKVDDWTTIEAAPTPEPSDEPTTPPPDPPTKQQPPVAEPDSFGVRPGRARVLTVLDNDTDPNEDVLSITTLPTVPESVGRLDLVANGQALQFQPAVGAAGSATFEYTVDDGRGGRSSAEVTLTIVPETTNNPPTLKERRTSTARVATGASVTYDVLADWQDPDGDEPSLAAATPKDGGTARFTPAGAVTYDASGVAPGAESVALTVTDGRAEADGELRVEVLADTNQPPVALSDLALARADRPLTLKPVVNDLDPNNDTLRLSQVTPVGGASITLDRETSTATFRAPRAGAYLLPYTVTDGQLSDTGVIRVQVLAAGVNHPPVAVADSVTVPTGQAVTADALANDLDVDDDVLVVRSVEVPQDSGLSVAVLGLRGLQVTAERRLSAPVTVTYTVSDGIAESSANVIVRTVDPPATNKPPTIRDDTATVRSGDIATVDVLADDEDPEGGRLTLSPELSVSDPDLGLLFVDDGRIRFQAAPTEVPVAVTAVYTAVDPQGNRASGQVTLTVRPLDANNEPPSLPTVQARVLAGGTVRIVVPLDGVDPDGDSVTGLEPATPPTLGRIVSVDEGRVLVYNASADGAGTDSFTYRARDTRGLTSTGVVRVGVAPPSEVDQAPVAVDDAVTVRPGTPVAIPVLDNDSDADGDLLALDATAPFTAPDGVSVNVAGDRLALTSPQTPGTVVVQYAVVDGRGGRDIGFLSVTSDPDAPLQAPLARDDVLTDVSSAVTTAGVSRVEVDVRVNDDDLDGVREDLQVEPAGPNAARATAVAATPDRLLVELAAQPQIVAYAAVDVDGLRGYAFVQVPGLDADRLPVLEPDASATATSGTPTPIRVTDYVQDPEGRPIRLSDTLAATAGGGSAEVTDPTTLTFTAEAAFAGTTAVSFMVTDAPATTDGEPAPDQAARSVLITLPIRVVPAENQPPTFAPSLLRVARGEDPAELDLRTAVRDPDPEDAATLRFGGLTGSAPGLSAALDGSVLTVAAQDATSAAPARFTVTVTDSAGHEVQGRVDVQVVTSTRPLARANPDTAQTTPGERVSASVLGNDANPFPDTPLRLVGVEVVAGEAKAEVAGDAVAVTPAENFSGTVAVRYTVQDKTGDAARRVTGQLSVAVRGRPARPAGPPVVVGTDSGAATVRLVAPADGGSPIVRFDVDAPGTGYGQRCTTDVCRLTGLDNGTAYTFRYRAVNAVGEGPWSAAAAAVTPDTVPGAPAPPKAAFVAGGVGGAVDVSWGLPLVNEGSAVTRYRLVVSPSERVIETAAVRTRVTGLENGVPYTFRVLASNRAGEGLASAPSAPETPAGVPGTPSAPTAEGDTGPLGGRVEVRWAGPADNGAAISAYELRVFRGGVAAGTVRTSATSASVPAVNGQSYTFQVVARNKSGDSPVGAPSAPVVPFSKPAAVGAVSADEGDGRLTLSFAPPADGGQAIERFEYQLGGGGWSPLGGGGVISGLRNGTTYTVRVRACNTYCADPSSGAATGVPFGPPGATSVRVTQSGGNVVTFGWTAPSPNGRPITRTEYSVDGGPWTAAGADGGSWTSNAGFNRSYAISVRSVDSEGGAGGQGTASAATGVSSVRIERYGSGPGGSECSNWSCAYFRVVLTNFDPRDYSIQPDDNGPVVESYPPRTARVGADGTGSAGEWFFGYPGRTVWAVVNGFRGELTWPSRP